MLNELIAQPTEDALKECSGLEFKPENNPTEESVNGHPNEQASAEDSPSLFDTGEGVVEFKPKTDLPAETINEQLKKHQLIADWDKQKEIQSLHVWTERFRFGFKLKFEEVPAIMIDKIGRSTYGHFRPGRNGFGLRNEVAINETCINEREYWQTLGTLLHELLHAEEEFAGTAGQHNYHKVDFRKRAESLGLIIDQWGHMQYAPAPSPFWDILGKHGITASDIPAPVVRVTKPGNSKLKLWICECKPKPVHVRVAIKDFEAKCLKCNAKFKRQD